MFRVVCEQTVGNAKSTTSTVWQGETIEELSLRYPPSEIFGADKLDQFTCSDLVKNYQFEQFTAGEWVVIDDPRVRLTPETEFERLIDAENRRLYPGDYIDEDDEYDYSYGDVDEESVSCDSCGEDHYYDPCDVDKIDLSKLKVVDVCDDCTVYLGPEADYVIVRGDTRVFVTEQQYKDDTRPLHWLREAVM